MPPVLLRLLAIGLITWIGSELFRKDEEVSISKDSDCDKDFKRFNRRIEISPDKVEKLRRAHYTIRNKVTSYLQNNTKLPIPKFFIQGSYKTKTLIENTTLKSDVDLGIFFPSKPGIYADAIQNHIKRALQGHTRYGVTIKTPCVRLNYVSDFHIDIPIYFEDINGKTFFGARGYEWEESDPKGFIEWFKNQTQTKPQLHRIIKYLKAWLENVKQKTGRKLPSGLAITLWAIEYYQKDRRDDVAFIQTSLSILEYLNNNYKKSWNAFMPVAPYDDILDRLNYSQKDFFYDELKVMSEIGMEALTAKNKTQAVKKWRKVFGSKF